MKHKSIIKKEPKFNGVYSRNNLPKRKDGLYVINLDEFKSIGTHWIALYVNGYNIICFDSFEAEHIPKSIRKFMENKNNKRSIYTAQPNDSIICGTFA